MAKRTKKTKKGIKLKLNIGNVSFLGIILVSGITAYFSSLVSPLINILILAILGATIAIQNISKNEEINFMLAITTLTVVILGISLSPLMNFITQEVNLFLANLVVAFGVAGFIVALGKILKMSWD